MEDKRAKTLEALEKFIQSQKTLLERTHADIARLGELRKDVENDPPHDWDRLGSKLNDPAFRLSEQLDAMPALPQNLDWSVFAGADPAPFRTLAANAREAYVARNTPPQKQLTAPSALRQFVAARRVTIIDPVLSTFRLPDDLAVLSSDDEPDPEELRRARERDKIRDLKKRRIEGDAGTPFFAGLGLRRHVSGVFIRRDQEDESAEVDISMGDEDRAPSALGSGSEYPMAVVTPTTSVTSPVSASLPAQTSTRRESRPTRKAQTDFRKAKAPPKAKPQPKPKVEPDEEEEQPTPTTGPPRDKNGKAKSETYKQAWSVSEQHLLERLLEEIPDGEKNRWAKISKAMNGRRTARQVASRVQKYYEKLKRFGIEVGGSKGTAAG
ncbi:hypothetical protein C8Q80DRAFT_1147443 [Daedaleopsis nitida]|nr:hypothetical protein C8Q80DRAFT_1147443 [Daedaleopsis nitida]